MSNKTYAITKPKNRDGTEHEIIDTGHFGKMLSMLQRDGGRFLELHETRTGPYGETILVNKVASNYVDAERTPAE